jgi:hypothetical protein
VTSSFPSQLSILQVKYIIVTGSSTTLFPPFLPGPLLSDPSAFQLLYHSGDAYLFEYVMVLP